MANEPNATPPAGDPPADKLSGEVKLRTRPGYNYIDGDFKLMDGETVTVSADEAKKRLAKAPDYLMVAKAKEDKEQ